MGRLIADKYKEWEAKCEERFNKLKSNEEELNRIFIEIYGLQKELTPDVAAKDVTVRRADLQREIKSLISYAVGCLFGRYSVNKDGLMFAGGDWDEWFDDNRDILCANGYKVVTDNIIQVYDDEYSDRDMTGLFVDWVKTTYGADTLEQNLAFIAGALPGGSANQISREVIRSYFLNSFYADHCSTYSVTGSGKRPIYWMFSSGKKNGFKALIYMHRYQPDLLARMRTDYVHEHQERLSAQIKMLEDALSSVSAPEKAKLNRQLTKYKEQSLEIRKFEEKIHHLADMMIPIDLDDGVKANYAKFEDVLEKIK